MKDAVQIDQMQEPDPAGLDARFIGVRPDDVALAMAADEAFAPIAERLLAFHDALTRAIELETGAFRRVLERLYAPHNPDRDTVAAHAAAGGVEELTTALAYAFEKANFLRLADVDIEAAMDAASGAGLKVKLDPGRVKRLDLFIRGKTTVERRRRHWRAPLRGRAETLQVYRRLGVIVQPKDCEGLLLRLYRDIPAVDVEALLPHADVAMNWADRLKIAVGGAGALGGIGAKIITGGVMLSPGSLAIPAAVAFGGLGVKSFLGYRHARRARVSQRTHHLYNLSLASNGAVLHILTSLVTAQEICEALLLYAALATRRFESETEAARWIEAWLRARFGVEVDFEIADARESLDRLGLWSERDRLRVASPEAACERLGERVVRPMSCTYHAQRAGLKPA